MRSDLVARVVVNRARIAGLLRQLNELGIDFKDLRTEESSLEDIFVNLVSTRR